MRGSRRIVLVIMAVTALWALVGGLFQPFLPLYIASVGGTATDVGIAGASSALAFLAAEAVWGWASDRVGAGRPLLISKLVTTAAFLGYLWRTELWWIYILQFVRGISEVAMAPIGRALLARHVASERRGTIMGLYFTTQSLARSGTGFVGGGLIDGIGFRALFALCAALSFASGILAFLGLRGTRELDRAADRASATAAAPTEGFRRQFTILSILAGLGFWAQSGWWMFFPLFAATIVGLSASQVGILTSLAGIAVLVFTLPGGRLADRYGRKPLLMIGLAISSIPAVAIAIGAGTSFGALAVLSFLLAAGNATSNPARQALIADIAPAGRQGLTMGVYGVAEDVGILVGPLLGGILWDRIGPGATFAMFAAVYFVTIATAAVLLREPARRRAPAADAALAAPPPTPAD
ncbi:MAG TPA: MFS transporter [Candidatus Limnocylindria bacterium]|nr:MFS transporter [Candidatus Limnocylindria bacterium]